MHTVELPIICALAGVNLQFLWIAALLRPITYYTDHYDSKTKLCDTLSSKVSN